MAKGRSPSFQFFPDAWLSSTDVTLMGPAGEGAYIRLLALAWLNDDCGLPADDDSLAVLSRLGADWLKKSGQRVKSKFREENGRLYNDRLLEERSRQAEWVAKSAEGGRRSAAKRKGGSTTVEAKSKGGSSVVEVWRQPKGNSSSSSSISIPPTPKMSEALQAAFDACLALHPNADTDAAGRAFVSLIASGEITEADAAKMEPGMRRWLDSEAWEQGQGRYSPEYRKFSTWIRERAWLSHPKQSAAAKAEASRTSGYVGPEIPDGWVHPALRERTEAA